VLPSRARSTGDTTHRPATGSHLDARRSAIAPTLKQTLQRHCAAPPSTNYVDAKKYSPEGTDFLSPTFGEHFTPAGASGCCRAVTRADLSCHGANRILIRSVRDAADAIGRDQSDRPGLVIAEGG
jgi:hypothetical protein